MHRHYNGQSEKGQKDKQWFTKHYTEQYEKCEDTKVVIRSRKSKKDKHHNGQNKKDKKTNNDLENITQKTKE